MTPPLVALHGFLGRGASYRRLGPSYAPDLVGHDGRDGGDAPIDGGFALEVARIASLVRARFPGERVELCGYSLGGRVALALAVEHPELVARLIVVGAQPGLADDTERAARREWDEKWARLLEKRGLASFLAEWEAQPLFASQHRLPAEVRDEQRAIREGLDARGLARAMRILGLARMPNLWPSLSVIAVPVEIVVGRLDAKFVALGERMAALLPKGRVHVVPDVGHNVLLEDPDALARVIADRP